MTNFDNNDTISLTPDEVISCIEQYIRLCYLEKTADEDGDSELSEAYYLMRKGDTFAKAKFAMSIVISDKDMARSWAKRLLELIEELEDYVLLEASEWLRECAAKAYPIK